MRYSCAARVLCFICLVFLSGAAPASQPATAHLTIKVVDLRNHNGQLVFCVFNQPDGFPAVQAKSVNWQVRAVGDDNTFVCDLPPGKYGASVLHDENSNGQMDTNFAGIPKEGYGVTNNPKPRFRGATYQESEFNLPAEGATLTISLQYF